MEHAKVKLTMRTLHGKICDVYLGEMHLFTATRLVAEPFCTCWNEHDTLKAKADLLDEFITNARTIAAEPGFIHSKIVKRVTVLANDYMGLK